MKDVAIFVGVKIKKSVHADLIRKARANMRSLASEIRLALTQYAKGETNERQN